MATLPFNHTPRYNRVTSLLLEYRNMPKAKSILPKSFKIAHDLCFCVHDILAQLLISGLRSGAFVVSLPLEDPTEAVAFASSGDIFEWLERTGRTTERAKLVKTTVLPAVLSDMLHYVYEALQSSKKGKLAVTYTLLRKPLQESLFLLESIAVGELAFASKLATDPMLLRPKSAGGHSGHTRRIAAVLNEIGSARKFDADYIAQLRYMKTEDGFDGACNKAMHLFTEHDAIRTEVLNINFVFSDLSAMHTQWSYMYTRLPYLLAYAHDLVEHIAAGIVPTESAYLDDVARRVSGLVLLWGDQLPAGYENCYLREFMDETSRQLAAQCAAKGWRAPTKRDLHRMGHLGAIPGESAAAVKKRHALFVEQAEEGRRAFAKR